MLLAELIVLFSMLLLAILAGIALYVVTEILADWLEGRQNRAAKQVKAMPHRKAVKR